MLSAPLLDPGVADVAPDDPVLTDYDEKHIITYMQLLHANAENADWREVVRIVRANHPANAIVQNRAPAWKSVEWRRGLGVNE